MTDGLKPCPFCGRAVKIIHVDPSGYNVAYYNDEYAVAIVHMGDGKCFFDDLSTTYNQREESMMIDLWNRRASETTGEISDGESLRLIADGGEYKVFATPIGDKPYYLLKGHKGTDYLFSEAQWDQYARVIAYADIKIRGGIE